MFNQPGTRPEDNVEMAALTVATMEGESYTCMWGEDSEFEEEEIVELEVVKEATIQMTNLKSKYKPFIIFEPGVVIAPWIGEDYSFWNHWPVSQLPSDGRVAPAADRPSHTSFSCGAPVVHEGEGDSHIAVMLYGLTKSRIEALVPLARSWNYPARLTIISGDVESKGYDKFQRAYVLECKDSACRVELNVSGREDSPIVNPVFVFKGWGQREVSAKVSGEEFEEGENYRAGYEKKIDGIDLVLWFEGESEETETLLISPVD